MLNVLVSLREVPHRSHALGKMGGTIYDRKKFCSGGPKSGESSGNDKEDIRERKSVLKIGVLTSMDRRRGDVTSGNVRKKILCHRCRSN
jgi:hypothetical protein